MKSLTVCTQTSQSLTKKIKKKEAIKMFYFTSSNTGLHNAYGNLQVTFISSCLMLGFLSSKVMK